jgi:hypothetical protein
LTPNGRLEKRTSWTSHKCQEATYAVQQTSMQLMTRRARGW